MAVNDDEVDKLMTELIAEGEERNRARANDMYWALQNIIEECGKPKPDVAYIKARAERVLR